MDCGTVIHEVGVAGIQEVLNRVIFQAKVLISETHDVVIEKKSFREFSKSISELNTLLQTLNPHKVEAAGLSNAAKTTLETLNSQLSDAADIIKCCKSGSQLRLLPNSHSILLRMKNISREIAHTVSLMELINLDMALNIKSRTEHIVDDLMSIEFHSEALASQLHVSLSHNGKDREYVLNLLEKISEAVGTNTNKELMLLKQEKEAMEAQEKQAEALQVSQLIQLLNDTRGPIKKESISMYHCYPIDSLVCALSNEIMTDPVAILCGHSFERKAIQLYFGKGEKTCPTCTKVLQSHDLSPNLSLRNSIEEWKRQDGELKFHDIVRRVPSDECSVQNKALEEMQLLMQMPHFAERFASEGLLPKLIEILKHENQNTSVAIKCLYYLSKYCDSRHKGDIVEAGGVDCIVKQIYNGEAGPDDIAILLELSAEETLGDQIGKTKDCIPLLVSLLDNNNPGISQTAHNVLQNLTFNTHFVVQMAEAGHFQPFVSRFDQGTLETRTYMAAALVMMQLKENRIEDLMEKQFVHNLVNMLSSSSPASKSTCLKSIKKLLAYNKMEKQLLEEPATMPLLLGLISFVRSDPILIQEAAEILTLIIQASQISDFEMYQGLQELQSQHSVDLFCKLLAISDTQNKVQVLQLLVELSRKSDVAQDLIREDKDVVGYLFFYLDSDHIHQLMVRKWALKLLYCLAKDHPGELPLPPSPAKENAISSLVTIFANSSDVEERSTAAGIIGCVPADDDVIDEILSKSEALKAIQEVICSTYDENSWNRTRGDHQGTLLLENALAALLHYTNPSKPKLQREVSKLDLCPSLIRVLSRGSSREKQLTATALAHLSISTTRSISEATIIERQANNSMIMKFLSNMSLCCSASPQTSCLCSIHGAACSPRDTFCLLKADAVRPLVQTLSETESGVAEAALMALETLVTDHHTLSHAAAAISESEGVVAILQVLEKGSTSAKEQALGIFQKILKHTNMTDAVSQRSARILIQLLQDGMLKKKAALVLKQMNIIPEQSSYF